MEEFVHGYDHDGYNDDHKQYHEDDHVNDHVNYYSHDDDNDQYTVIKVQNNRQGVYFGYISLFDFFIDKAF